MSGPGGGANADPFEGGGVTADPFQHDDAPYLLGSLDAADGRAFEAHLSACAACADRVASLRPVLSVLAAVGDEGREALIPDGAEPGERRPDRLASLIHRVERRRRRTTWIAAGMGAIAAAAIVALTVTVAAQPSAPAAVAQPMTAIDTSAIQATAVMNQTSWGTEITIDCRYASGSGDARAPSNAAAPGYGPGHGSASTGGEIYTLQVVDQAGTSHDLGSWALTGESAARFTSGTALSPDEIRAVTIAAPDGTALLRLTT